MHTIILLLYIPYIAGGRSENLGGNLVISNSKRFFDGIGFASNSAKTGGGGGIALRSPLVPAALPCAGTVQKEKPFYTMANQQWTRCGGYIKGRQNLVLMGKPRILSHLH